MCRRIAAAGYTDVAIFGNAGIDPDSSHEQVEAIRRAAEGAGLVPSLLIARARLELGVQDAIAGYRRTIDQAATLGASWLLDLGAGSEVAADDYFALMRQAAPYAASAGVCMVLKPHGGLSLTTDDLIRACQRVNHSVLT
jgi:sugar phosphate isomerase/epimerase